MWSRPGGHEKIFYNFFLDKPDQGTNRWRLLDRILELSSWKSVHVSNPNDWIHLWPSFWTDSEKIKNTNVFTKAGIITIGTWYKAQYHQTSSKKVFHTSFEIHLFLGNVSPLQCITELPDDTNSQKKPKNIFSGHKLIKMYNCTRKWWNPNISPCLSNFPTQELISHT